VIAEKSPRAGRQRGREQTDHRGIILNAFPTCNLHRRPIVDGFPPRCPMRETFALQAIRRLQDEAYAKLGRIPEADTSGLDDLCRAGICDECTARLLADPHVRHLRAKRAGRGCR